VLYMYTRTVLRRKLDVNLTSPAKHLTRLHELRSCLVREFFDLATVALSFVFNNYCSIID